jgi:hypothetical protein
MNKKKLKKALLIAPFWGKSDHVGVYRVDRFKRWLTSEGYIVIIIKGGIKNEIQKFDWGIEISIPNSIDNITNKLIQISSKIHTKLFLYIWNNLVSVLSVPDENRLWARKVLKQPLVNNNIEGVNFVISSSPPHSSHITAFQISNKINIPLIVDMRDGWLDEPLRSNLRNSKRRTYIEGKLEYKILARSNLIFVTSAKWMELLLKRYPEFYSKVTILTNAYPLFEFVNKSNPESKQKNILKLLHAGRFTGSSYLRKSDILLSPLFNSVVQNEDFLRVNIILVGRIKRKDQAILTKWVQQFQKINSDIIIKEHITRMKLFNLYKNADGLLLLSTSFAAIPSKTFEYIKSQKPIFAVTLKGSAVWELAKDVPQMFVHDYTSSKKDYDVIDKFLNACRSGKFEINVPNQYSEEHLSKIFMSSIEECLD